MWRAKATQSSYRQDAKRILTVFHAMQTAGIEPQHAIRYLDLRGNESPAQASREVALLRHLLTKATHWGLVPHNPLLGFQ